LATLVIKALEMKLLILRSRIVSAVVISITPDRLSRLDNDFGFADFLALAVLFVNPFILLVFMALFLPTPRILPLLVIANSFLR
jgi:hypothetical protein